jgi:hypothetical protein
MPIRIKCPKCQTVLGVKESLAGKKAHCPKCRYLLAIPAPKVAAAGPAPDAEALAASLFADEPAPVKPAVTQFIEFECPFCIEMVKVNADMAGKQVPCPNPECKRIVKVPLLKEDKPKDWRQVNPRGPSLAKKDNDQLEGAWSTAETTRVSTEALDEAGALPVKKVPIKVSTWIKLGVGAFVLLIALVGGVWGLVAWAAHNRLYGALNDALAHVEPTTKLKPTPTAEIHRGAAEFHMLNSNAKDAKYHINKTRSGFAAPNPKTPADPERDVVLIELALALIEFGGSDKEADNETRLKWDDVSEELRRTLSLVSSLEARQTALRAVADRLIAKGETDRAFALADTLAPATEADATPKEEVLGGGDEDPPAKVQPKKPPSTPVRPLLAAQQLALLVGSGQKDKAKAIMAEPDPKNKDAVLPLLTRLGYAEGKARQGDFEAARLIANHQGKAVERLEANVGVAVIALAKKNTAEAKVSAQKCVDVYKEIRAAPIEIHVPAWLMIQLTRVCARADQAAETAKIIQGIPEKTDKTARALAQMEVLLAKLDASTEPVPAAIIDEHVTFKDTLAYALAVENVARHNTRLGRRSEALAMVDSLDDAHKAFAQIGVALGIMDARK